MQSVINIYPLTKEFYMRKLKDKRINFNTFFE